MSKKSNVLNTVKTHRMKAGLLVGELAQKTHIPEILLHGIETGQKPALLSQVSSISEALQVPAITLFPKAIKACQKYLQKKSKQDLYWDSDALCKIESLGINASHRFFTFRFRLKNGLEVCHKIDYRTSLQIKETINTLYNHDEPGESGFLWYETESESVLLNLRELTFCHFLFDRDIGYIVYDKEEVGVGETDRPVLVYMTDSAKPLSFAADADEVELDFENDVCDIISTQFQDILSNSDQFGEDGRHMFSFVDVDGEEAIFRVNCVSLMTIPIEFANPKINNSVFEDYCQAEDREESLVEIDETDGLDNTDGFE